MGIFSHVTNTTCPDKTLADPPQENLFGSINFQKFASFISFGCMVISCALCFFLIFKHATHYAIPKEQRQVIRIIFIIPVFAFMAFLSVAFNQTSIYLDPIEALYESLALSSFYMLLLAFIQENDAEREAFFQGSGGLEGYRITSLMVFQFPVLQLLVFAITEITEATNGFCATSNSLHFAHIWTVVINGVSTGAAVMSILRFYKTVKPRVVHRSPMAKLVGFKLIIFLTFLQNTIFSLLTSTSHLKPTSKLTFKDLSVVLPNLIVSIEMVFFAIGFQFIYKSGEYNMKKGASAVPLGHGGYAGGPAGFKAIIQALNITDIIRAMIGTVVPRLQGTERTKIQGTGQEYDRVRLTQQHNDEEHGRYGVYNPQPPLPYQPNFQNDTAQYKLGPQHYPAEFPSS